MPFNNSILGGVLRMFVEWLVEYLTVAKHLNIT